jgi:hypothetical protein
LSDEWVPRFVTLPLSRLRCKFGFGVPASNLLVTLSSRKQGLQNQDIKADLQLAEAQEASASRSKCSTTTAQAGVHMCAYSQSARSIPRRQTVQLRMILFVESQLASCGNLAVRLNSYLEVSLAIQATSGETLRVFGRTHANTYLPL